MFEIETQWATTINVYPWVARTSKLMGCKFKLFLKVHITFKHDFDIWIKVGVYLYLIFGIQISIDNDCKASIVPSN